MLPSRREWNRPRGLSLSLMTSLVPASGPPPVPSPISWPPSQQWYDAYPFLFFSHLLVIANTSIISGMVMTEIGLHSHYESANQNKVCACSFLPPVMPHGLLFLKDVLPMHQSPLPLSTAHSLEVDCLIRHYPEHGPDWVITLWILS